MNEAKNGWVKIHRRILQWEWYGDTNTFRVFIHLLLSANHKKKRWKGIIIQRGQLVTSVAKLSVKLNLSSKQIRTAIKHLKETNEVATKATNKYTLITLLNYSKFQNTETEKGKQKGNQEGTQGATNKNDKKYKKYKESSLLMQKSQKKLPGVPENIQTPSEHNQLKAVVWTGKKIILGEYIRFKYEQLRGDVDVDEFLSDMAERLSIRSDEDFPKNLSAWLWACWQKYEPSKKKKLSVEERMRRRAEKYKRGEKI